MVNIIYITGVQQIGAVVYVRADNAKCEKNTWSLSWML